LYKEIWWYIRRHAGVGRCRAHAAANPNLTWRDVQYILVNTAEEREFQADWQINGAGKHISHNYGFGLVDAAAAVYCGAKLTNVAPEISASSPVVMSAWI
jgi:hypothetical protein